MADSNGSNGTAPYRDDSPRTPAPRHKYKRKRGPLFKFMVAFLSIIVVFLVAGATVFMVYSHIMNSSDLTRAEQEEQEALRKVLNLNLEDSSSNVIDFVKPIPTRTNFVLMVLDDDGQSSRADAIMIGCYNSATNELNLISVPRDTYAELSQESLDALADVGRTKVPKTMKINAIVTHSGKVHGPSILVNHLEETFGIDIHYYVQVKLDGFEKLIDTIGGVWFDVPQRMKYTDPVEDLYIDLYPGEQRLNGHDAMGLVRYRKGDRDENGDKLSPDYPTADLQRVKVQQAFLTAAITQALTTDNIVNNAGSYIEILYKYIETNMSAVDAVKYFSAVRNLKGENIFTYTAYGTVSSNGENYNLDSVKNHELIQRIFYDHDTGGGNPE